MTFQVRETLIHRGQRRQIRALPLTGCERPVPSLWEGVSSGCWRGYEGMWEVQNDVLHLVQLTEPDGGSNKEGLRLMFPEATGPVEATWFSGEIVPDDVINPDDAAQVKVYKRKDWPLQLLWFTLVVHRGKLLLEEAIDLQQGVRQARLTRHVDELFPAMEAAFLRDIQAHAEDVAPKLVYADWLEERDDPRGTLLRREVERLKKEGPPRRWTERNPRHDIPGGHVPPEDITWYWRYLAGVPDRTPEDRQYRQLLEGLGLNRHGL